MKQQELVQAALAARGGAYAPYSHYLVGAALEDSSGAVWTGANVENRSFGATLCAERVAVGKMVSGGGLKIHRLALVTEDGGAPCGICLQTLLEFAPDPEAVVIIVADNAGKEQTYTLAELLPHGFRSAQVGRTNVIE